MLKTIILQMALLTWSPNIEADLAGYKVYFGGGPRSYSKVFTVQQPNTSWKSKTLGPGTWFFAVTAFDSSGNESDYSEEVSVTVAGQPEPVFIEPPDTVATYLVEGNITVDWNEVAGATGYLLYNWNQDGQFNQVRFVGAPPRTISSINPDRKWTFRLRTLAGGDTSDFSLPFDFEPIASKPAAPGLLIAGTDTLVINLNVKEPPVDTAKVAFETHSYDLPVYASNTDTTFAPFTLTFTRVYANGQQMPPESVYQQIVLEIKRAGAQEWNQIKDDATVQRLEAYELLEEGWYWIRARTVIDGIESEPSQIVAMLATFR